MGLCLCKAGGHAKVFDKIDIEGILEAEYGAMKMPEKVDSDEDNTKKDHDIS